jgi:uncharacterized protein with beta-barrel porin domain
LRSIKVWRLGVAVGYQSSTLDTSTGAKSDGKQAQAGVALKYNPGPLLLAGALTTAAPGTTRRAPWRSAAFAASLKAIRASTFFSGSLRAAYVFGAPSLYFKPVLDASVTRIGPATSGIGGGGGAPLSCKAPRRPYPP